MRIATNRKLQCKDTVSCLCGKIVVFSVIFPQFYLTFFIGFLWLQVPYYYIIDKK